MPELSGSFPLICRAPDEPIFRRRETTLNAAAFLDTAHRTADALPASGFVVNLCRDRLWFTVALVAALLREQVTLLTSNRSPDGLAALAEEFPSAYAVAEDPVPTQPLELHRLQRDFIFP